VKSVDARAKEHHGAGLSIREYDDDLAHVLKALTVEWMTDERVLEARDLGQLSNPRRMIIAGGGAILFDGVRLSTKCAIYIRGPDRAKSMATSFQEEMAAIWRARFQRHVRYDEPKCGCRPRLRSAGR
jgi:hypothetical protein